MYAVKLNPIFPRSGFKILSIRLKVAFRSMRADLQTFTTPHLWPDASATRAVFFPLTNPNGVD